MMYEGYATVHGCVDPGRRLIGAAKTIGICWSKNRRYVESFRSKDVGWKRFFKDGRTITVKQANWVQVGNDRIKAKSR